MPTLKKKAFYPFYILSQEPKEVQEALAYKEKLVKILDIENKVWRFKIFPFMNV